MGIASTLNLIVKQAGLAAELDTTMTAQSNLKKGLNLFVEVLANPEYFAAMLVVVYLDISWLKAFYQQAAWSHFTIALLANLVFLGVLVWSGVKRVTLPIYVYAIFLGFIVVPALSQFGLSAFMPWQR